MASKKLAAPPDLPVLPFAILHRVQTAHKPETRARRIEQFVEMLARGEKLHR